MRHIIIGVSILSIILLSLLLFPFTDFGNSFISSKIEDKLKSKSALDIKINSFKLGFSEFNTSITLDDSKVDISGIFDIFDETLSFKYNIDITDLSKLNNLTNKNLHGSFKTNGEIDGTFDDMKVLGSSNFARSETNYRYTSQDKTLNIVSKSLHMEDLLYSFGEDIYLIGELDVFVKLKDFEGDIVTKIYESHINSELLGYPDAIYIKNGYITTDVTKEITKSKVDIFTSIANIRSQNTTYNLKNGQIDSDYILELFDFSKLKPFLGFDLRGSSEIFGEIRQKDAKLVVNGKSDKFLDGQLEFEFKNSLFSAKLKFFKLYSLLNTLYYPEIFNADMIIEFYYNVLGQVGELRATGKNGKFRESDLSMGMRALTKVSLIREEYDDILLEGKLAEGKFIYNFDIQSNNTLISSKESSIDIKNSKISSDINIKVRDGELWINLSGDSKSPRLFVDPSDYIKKRAIKELKDKFPEHNTTE